MSEHVYTYIVCIQSFVNGKHNRMYNSNSKKKTSHVTVSLTRGSRVEKGLLGLQLGSYLEM